MFKSFLPDEYLHVLGRMRTETAVSSVGPAELVQRPLTSILMSSAARDSVSHLLASRGHRIPFGSLVMISSALVRIA